MRVMVGADEAEAQPNVAAAAAETAGSPTLETDADDDGPAQLAEFSGHVSVEDVRDEIFDMVRPHYGTYIRFPPNVAACF